MQHQDMAAMQSEIIRRALIDPYEYYDIEHSDQLYLLLRFLYVQTRGVFNINLNREISNKRPALIKDELIGNNYIFTNQDIRSITNDLNNEGYSISKPYESLENNCDQLHFALDQIPKDSPNSSRHYITSLMNLYQFEIVRKICTDKSIKKIADNFLNCNSILNLVSAWKTSYVPKDKRNLGGDAQLFHFDCDHNRFLKIFLYLDDVYRRNGPHVYIPNTSTNGRSLLPNELNRDGRISNPEIIKYGLVPRYIEGKKGTLIFGDTQNLHKGTPVAENTNRYILEIQYVDSPFGIKSDYTKDEIIYLNS